MAMIHGTVHRYMDEVMVMSVVLEQTIGNTKIRIHDDYFRDTTPEQVQKMLERAVSRAKAGLVATSKEERA